MLTPVAKLDVVNQALIELGKMPVAAISDSEAAQILSNKIDILLPLLILSDIFNWAIKFVSNDSPLVGQFSPEWLYQYQLPADFGRFFRFITNYFPTSYAIMDGLLLTSQIPVQYYYVVNTIPFANLETTFYRALSLWTAADCCMVLTQSEKLTQYINSKFLDAKSQTILFNQTERMITSAPNDFDRLTYI